MNHLTLCYQHAYILLAFPAQLFPVTCQIEYGSSPKLDLKYPIMRDCCANPKLCFALAYIALKNFPFLITLLIVIYDSVSFANGYGIFNHKLTFVFYIFSC